MHTRIETVRVWIACLSAAILSSCAIGAHGTPVQQTPSPEPPAVAFQVTLDDSGCTVSGPTEVPTGEYSFLLENLSALNVEMGVLQLLDGHKYQDMLDLQSEPGQPFSREPWMSQPFYITKDHKVWNVTLDEQGEHVIVVAEYGHAHIWLCIPFQVVEAESD